MQDNMHYNNNAVIVEMVWCQGYENTRQVRELQMVRDHMVTNNGSQQDSNRPWLGTPPPIVISTLETIEGHYKEEEFNAMFIWI